MTRSGQQLSSPAQRGRPRHAIALLTLLCGTAVLFSVTSCGLLGIVPTPEFSISGVRVAMMPFLGPDTWWYGENPTGKYVHQRAASVLREAGAQLVTSEKVVRELQNYAEDTDPPWTDYGKRLLHDLLAVGLPNWLYPETDLIVSFAPFNNLPTHYRASVDGEQKWFAQCGFESVALSWLFPRKEVRVDAPCLATGAPLSFTMRDGVFESREPEGICMYVDIPISKWAGNLPFA